MQNNKAQTNNNFYMAKYGKPEILVDKKRSHGDFSIRK